MTMLKSLLVEKTIFTRSLQVDTIKAVFVPSIIAPAMRGVNVLNTEMNKKSVYLSGGFFDKDKIIGRYEPLYVILHKLCEN